MSSVREYPPKPMVANSTKIHDSSYGNGMYKASSSTGSQPWKAFDHDNEGSLWHSGDMINEERTGYSGVPEWIQLQLPNPIQLKTYVMWSRADGGYGLHNEDFPNKFELKGSNDGTSWTTIDMRDDVAKTVTTDFEKKEFTAWKSEPYRYFRLVVENVGPGAKGRGWKNGTTRNRAFVAIAGLSFYGEEEEEEKKGFVWNPLEDGFFSMDNMALWVYVAAVVVVLLGLGYYMFLM